jgi:chemotaxis receptor (MCP) glutamine deamidase CheD
MSARENPLWANARLPPATAGLPRITIHIGGVQASREPVVYDTVLGSCIAACLYDPVAGVGGMNHFMLPEGDNPDNPTSARYGVHAMELLIREVMRFGGDRRRFQAKIFGGGHVLNIRKTLDGISRRNIEFVHRFLDTERIPVMGEDIGGFQARRVLFQPHNGLSYIRHLPVNDADRTVQEEAVYLISLKRRRLDGDVTLF